MYLVPLSYFLSVAVIDRTATFVANSSNPAQLEDKIREGQRSDPKFSFLNPADPYHAYYRDKMTRVMQGEQEAAPETSSGATPTGQTPAPVALDVGIEPPQSIFITDFPNISAVDL